MADRKYGRIFTQADVQAIFAHLCADGVDSDEILSQGLAEMDEKGTRFKFPVDEPVIVFRARDKRAEGVVKHYEDHQHPNAPVGFMEGIAAVRRDFREYREQYPELMKEPD